MWEIGGRLIVWGTLELIGPGRALVPWLAVALGLIVVGKSGAQRKSGGRRRDRGR